MGRRPQSSRGQGVHGGRPHVHLLPYPGEPGGSPRLCMVIAVVWHVVVNGPRLQPRRLEIRR
eukprot:4499223-Pyramimonas_sp.AAC.1